VDNGFSGHALIVMFVSITRIVCGQLKWAAYKHGGGVTHVYISIVAAGAPEHIVGDVVKSFNIAKVVRGTISETTHFLDHDETRYEYPKRAGIFKYASSSLPHFARLMAVAMHLRRYYHAGKAMFHAFGACSQLWPAN
jgi:hypothetical protein